MSKLRGCGPKTTPPPVRIGDLTLPARARPVPFWRYSLAVEPLTSPRVLVDAVPRAARGLLGAHDQVQRVDVGGHAEAAVGQLARLDFLAGGVDEGRHAGGALARLGLGLGGVRRLRRTLGLGLGAAAFSAAGLAAFLGAAFSALRGLGGLGRRPSWRPASWRPWLGGLRRPALASALARPWRPASWRPASAAFSSAALAAGFLAAGFLAAGFLAAGFFGGSVFVGRLSLGLLGLGGGLDVWSLLDLVGAHCYLPLMTTTEFLAPGTEPLMSSRLFSTSRGRS